MSGPPVAGAAVGFAAARALPAKPNLEHLKNEAKQRLHALRKAAPAAKLAEVQHHLAREYGFANWRDLKARVERPSPSPLSPAARAAVGDWVGQFPSTNRIGLHVSPSGEGLAITLDTPDFGFFGLAADDVVVEDDRLSFSLIAPLVEGFHQGFYEAWRNASEDRWEGQWTAHGITTPLDLARGTWPPAPQVEGLDGFWDGRLETSARMLRMIFRFKTDEHGTYGWLDSPDTQVLGRPVVSVVREGQDVTIAMRTLTIAGILTDDGQWIEARFVRGETDLPITLVHRPPGAAPPLPQRAPAIEVAPEVLAACAGVYATDAGMAHMVTVEDGRLWVQFMGSAAELREGRPAIPGTVGPKLDLLASAPTKFFWRIMDASAEFEIGQDGRAAAMVTRQNGRRSRATRIA